MTEFSYADVVERLFREFNGQHPLPLIVDVVRACLTDLEGQVPPGARRAAGTVGPATPHLHLAPATSGMWGKPSAPAGSNGEKAVQEKGRLGTRCRVQRFDLSAAVSQRSLGSSPFTAVVKGQGLSPPPAQSGR